MTMDQKKFLVLTKILSKFLKLYGEHFSSNVPKLQEISKIK